MKILRLAMTAVIVGSSWASIALAQQAADDADGTIAPARKPRSAPIGFERYYADQPMPAASEPSSPGEVAEDEPSTPAPGGSPFATNAAYKCNGCNPCCNSGCGLRNLGNGVELGDPFLLSEHTCFLKKHKIVVGGWLAQSYAWNPYNPSDRQNGPVTWINGANRYQMNELYMYLKRDTDTGGNGWDVGGRIDALYGTSYRWNTEAGLESKWNPHGEYGLALPQAYMEIAHNDTKVKIGHFISPVGFYTVGTFMNFFNMIPYTYQYGEPFTHTGIRVTHQLTEKINVGAALIHGWDAFDSSFNKWGGYLGTLTINGNQGDSLAFVQVYSHEPTFNAAQPFTQRYFQTVVYTRPLKQINENLTYVFQSDFGVQGGATSTGHTARWYGANQYLYYKVNNIWSWGGEVEWFRDEEGFRVNAPVPSPGSPNATGWAGAPGFAGNFYQITVGPRWTPLPNLTIRPNFRADWYAGPVNGANQLPYDGFKKAYQQILATDVIVNF